jgi:hypothetical protein
MELLVSTLPEFSWIRSRMRSYAVRSLMCFRTHLHPIWHVSIGFVALGFLIVGFKKEILLRKDLITEFGISETEKANDEPVPEQPVAGVDGE